MTSQQPLRHQCHLLRLLPHNLPGLKNMRLPVEQHYLILVAESDSAVQQVVSYFLDLEGYEVTTAADGIGALEAVEKSLPEVILLSPDLSGLNGIEVSRLIREKSQFKGIPILYIIDSEDSLLKMGQDIPPGYGVINKPIDPSKMTNTIKEYIDK